MSLLIPVAVVGLGSLAFRLVPLIWARQLPDRAAEIAEHAGLAVLVCLTVRSVVLHRDPAVPGGPTAAVVAACLALFLAYRGRSVLVTVAVGAATYLLLAPILALAL